MKKIYLDNSSTSFPKAKGVGEEVKNFIENSACNISRGGYNMAYDLEGTILETREYICKLFNFDNPKNVCFTPSVTYSLNYIISGLLKKGDHVISTSMEHNAVSRPIMNLEKFGVEHTFVKCSSEGFLDLDEFEKSFKENTKLCVICYASNVSGTLQDIDKISEICLKNNVPLVLDASQAAGSISIDFKNLNLSALCVPSHKGLLAPQGLGILVINDELANKVDPIILGGTGSISDKLYMPDFLPDKFEAGTINLPGIIGLHKSLEFILHEGVSNIRDHEMNLTNLFINEILKIDGIKLIGPKEIDKRVGVVSLDFTNFDNSEISYMLDDKFGIMTRCGLHCSPLSHKSLNTFPKGTVRFSFGYFNTIDDVTYAIDSIKKCIHK